MNKPKILITGSTGFLGRAVMSAIDDKYIKIGLKGKSHCDLTNQKYVDYTLQEYEPDYIIHLAAACGGIGINQKLPGQFLYDNLAMGMNLIESCRKYGRLKKFIMVGTVCSYPKYTPVPFQEEDLWNGYPEETNAPYGIAKKTLIEMLVAYNKQYGFNSTNLIPVNMYGPNDNFNPTSSHVIPALILKIDRAIQNNENSIILWGSGHASREFLYVEDCAQAIVSCLNVDTDPYPINIGTCSEITIKDLVSKIANVMGYNGNILYNLNYPDGQPRRCLDITKASTILNFTAKTNLDDGLKQTVDWYYKNKDMEKFVDYFNYIQ
jgi:GDP-L-fucose synthase